MKEYRYSQFLKVFSIVPSVFFILGLLFCIDWLAINLGLVTDTLFGDSATINYDSYLRNGLFLMFMGVFFLSQFNEIILGNKGIKVSVFYFFWIFVPWEDIIDITTHPFPGYRDPTLLRIIKVRNLTIFHRLAGLVYFTGSHPIILISKYISNYDDLVNSIEKELNRKKPNPRST